MRRFAVPLLLALASCTVVANRAAFVPRAVPIPDTGQPLGARAAVDLGATNAFDLAPPSAGDPNAGIQIPSHQVHGALDGRLTDDLSVSAIYERGLETGSTSLQASQPPVHEGDVTGYGVAFHYSIDTGRPGFRVGVHLQLMMWNVPWVEYRACVADCTLGPYQDSAAGADQVGTFALAVTPSYRVGRVTVFGGLTVTQQPTLAQKVVESSLDVDPDVQSGPVTSIAHAGLAVDVGDGFTASAFLDQVMTRSPAIYAPAVGVMLSVPIGRIPDRLPVTFSPAELSRP